MLRAKSQGREEREDRDDKKDRGFFHVILTEHSEVANAKLVVKKVNISKVYVVIIMTTIYWALTLCLAPYMYYVI